MSHLPAAVGSWESQSSRRQPGAASGKSRPALERDRVRWLADPGGATSAPAPNKPQVPTIRTGLPLRQCMEKGSTGGSGAS